MRMQPSKANAFSASLPVALGGVRQTPMGRHRLARPNRANFIGRVVTHGEDEIGGAWRSKLIPVLRAERRDS